MMTNGSTFDAPSGVSLKLPSFGGLQVIPVDYSGNLTSNRWMVDAASALGVGLNFGSTSAYSKIVGPHVKNSAGDGIFLDGSGMALYGAKVVDAGADGIEIGTNSRCCLVEGAWVEGSVANGIVDLENAYLNTVRRCYVAESVEVYAAIQTEGIVVDCIIVCDLTGIATPLPAIDHTAAFNGPIVMGNIVHITGNKSSLSAAMNCIDIDNGDVRSTPAVWNNIVFDDTTGSTAQSIYAYAAANNTTPFMFQGNKYYGAALTATGTFPTNLCVEAPTNEDPSFTDPSTGDYIPANDVTASVFINKIASESLDWIGSGPLSWKLGAGGGGGGGGLPVTAPSGIAR
jgi:hypothetical protein